VQKNRPIRVFLAQKPEPPLDWGITNLRCKADGCESTTRERKPYCPDHVFDADYVKTILDKLALRDSEIARVEKRGWRQVNVGGMVTREIIEEIRRHGWRTIERLARDIMAGQLAYAVIEQYAIALQQGGIVVIGRSTRGCVTVQLDQPA